MQPSSSLLQGSFVLGGQFPTVGKGVAPCPPLVIPQNLIHVFGSPELAGLGSSFRSLLFGWGCCQPVSSSRMATFGAILNLRHPRARRLRPASPRLIVPIPSAWFRRKVRQLWEGG